MRDILKINLAYCEKEPIHTPELLQPHGYVIVFDKNTQDITRCSENFNSISSDLANQFLKQNLIDIIPRSLYDRIQASLNFSTHKRHILLNQKIPKYFSDTISIFISDAKEEIILEIIPDSDEAEERQLDSELNAMIEQIVKASMIKDVFKIAALDIKKLLGYDRVMIYQFDEEYNGKVLSEAKEVEMESYLNLHYPASDIPAQARELYKTNVIRTIVDNRYKPVKFVSEKKSLLDMSHSYLRSVSPIHLEYLENMSVRATLTISIISEGRLWGLISCHHREPFFPNLKRQNLAQIFGSILGGIIQMREEAEREKKSSGLLSRLDLVMEMLLFQNSGNDLVSLIRNKIVLLQSIFSSDGFLVYTNNSFIAHNFPLSEKNIINLIQALDGYLSEKFFYTDSLVSVAPDLPEIVLKLCAGLMVIKLDTSPSSYWIWRRVEKTETISWGGNPNQKAILNQKGEISPRKSFEKYNQIVTKKSVPWNRSEKDFYIYLIPRLHRLYEIFESNKEIEIHKRHILHIEEERAKHFEELIEMLAGLIEMRDSYTGSHTKRVADYSVAIAKQLKLKNDEIRLLREAAILHDIGKIIIPDSILLKPGKLSYKEYELIKQHVMVGHTILDKIDYYKPIAHIVLHHHEKYDGSGYPFGKKGSEIPFLSHIMSVADAFDAMTTNRIYQRRRSTEDAKNELMKYRGKWYHPEVVDAAIEVIQNIEKEDSKTSQLPITQIERERFAYFFKDQLTGLFNATYLWMGINGLIQGISSRYFLLVELHGMTDLNSNFGWNKGNDVIQDFAQYLLRFAKEDQVFRVFGDDFIISFDSEDAMEVFLKNWKSIQIENVFAECKRIEKEKFIEIL